MDCLTSFFLAKWVYQIILVHPDVEKDITLSVAEHWINRKQKEHDLKQAILEEARQFANLLNRPLIQYKDIRREQLHPAAELGIVDDKDLFR